ncbi:MAG: hypothetical protein WAO19_02185 [Candidatus Kryptoniota bacterium]
MRRDFTARASANKPEEDARNFYIWFSLHGTNITKGGSRHDFFRHHVIGNWRRDVLTNIVLLID